MSTNVLQQALIGGIIAAGACVIGLIIRALKGDKGNKQ